MATESIASTASTRLHKSPRHAINNIEFVRALAGALLALAISAGVLITAYVSFSPELASYREAASAEDIQSRVVKGNDLIVRVGTGEGDPDKGLVLTELAKDGRAIVTRKISLRANDYPFVEYTMTGAHPGELIYLIWRTAENREEVSNSPLHWNGDQVTSHHLAEHEEWKGHIIEIGFDIYGDLREQQLVINNLSLLPGTWQHLLSTIWSQWTVYRGWTQKSAHQLPGTPTNPILSPTLAMAAWSGLALLLLGGSYLFTRSHNLVAYTTAIFIPWIALDLLWQTELTTQLEETKYLFAGKTQHEKHLADWDAELYMYAQHLKSEVLPAPGARIFLLHDSERRTYTRLKAQYYLLPHDIYNYDRFPTKKKTRKGDYILVLGNIEGLDYDPEKSTLRWKKKSLSVKQIDAHPQGHLYRVVKRKK